MPWCDWKKMTDAQKIEAMRLRPDIHTRDLPRRKFWIRRDGHVSLRKGGGACLLTNDACRELMRRLAGEHVRSKGDNREWKPGVIFHFNPRSE